MSNFSHIVFRDESAGDIFLIGLILGGAIGFVIGLYA